MLYRMCPKERETVRKGGKEQLMKNCYFTSWTTITGTNNKPKRLHLPRRQQRGSSQKGFVRDTRQEELAASSSPTPQPLLAATAPQPPSAHRSTGQRAIFQCPPRSREVRGAGLHQQNQRWTGEDPCQIHRQHRGAARHSKEQD